MLMRAAGHILLYITFISLLPLNAVAAVPGNVWQDFYTDDEAYHRLVDEPGERTDEELPSEALLKSDIDFFKQQLQQLFSMRIELINLTDQLRIKIEQHQPFSSRELQELNRQFTLRLAIRNDFISLIDRYIPFIRSDDLESTFRHKGISFALALNLALIDDHDTVLRFFEKEARLRKILNEDDPSNSREPHQLWKSLKKFHKLKYLFAKVQGIKIFNKYYDQFRSELEGDLDFNFIAKIIIGSETYKEYISHPNNGYWQELFRHFATIYWHRRLASEDQARRALGALSSTASEMFSTVVGQVGWRRGMLDGDLELEQSLTAILEPLDIITEKTPFRLTDSFIPGFWGHNALWLGSKEQLVELGLWAHPAVTPHHTLIEQGYGIIEAIRKGVMLSTIELFTNVDSLGVLRKGEITSGELRRGIINAFNHLGKPYDFSYDIETSDALICSELIYLTFERIFWPTRYYLGRWTLLPDDVVSRTLDSGPLSVELLYLDGEQIESNLVVGEMARLMESYQR
ncbi:MAG: hypothetical protein HN353_13245 [Bdellovibrionales bacterium]|jgi:hypothetical protein|nr:hypothetical protein [Bdellovibrionales bacterium]MBT3524943.1 hypothetical protein [Bdellovibrionales bacterium]MBT7667943.1 hypothetical protein [Bdellovibrionales bacterium]